MNEIYLNDTENILINKSPSLTDIDKITTTIKDPQQQQQQQAQEQDNNLNRLNTNTNDITIICNTNIITTNDNLTDNPHDIINSFINEHDPMETTTTDITSNLIDTNNNQNLLVSNNLNENNLVHYDDDNDDAEEEHDTISMMHVTTVNHQTDEYGDEYIDNSNHTTTTTTNNINNNNDEHMNDDPLLQNDNHNSNANYTTDDQDDNNLQERTTNISHMTLDDDDDDDNLNETKSEDDHEEDDVDDHNNNDLLTDNEDDYYEDDDDEDDNDIDDEDGDDDYESSLSMQTFLNHLSQYIAAQHNECDTTTTTSHTTALHNCSSNKHYFICILCKIIFNNNNELLNHSKIKHKLSINKYQENYIDDNYENNNDCNNNNSKKFKAVFIIKNSLKQKIIQYTTTNDDDQEFIDENQPQQHQQHETNEQNIKISLNIDKKLNDYDYCNTSNDNCSTTSNNSNENENLIVKLLFIDNYYEFTNIISIIKNYYNKNHDHEHQSSSIVRTNLTKTSSTTTPITTTTTSSSSSRTLPANLFNIVNDDNNSDNNKPVNNKSSSSLSINTKKLNSSNLLISPNLLENDLIKNIDKNSKFYNKSLNTRSTPTHSHHHHQKQQQQQTSSDRKNSSNQSNSSMLVSSCSLHPNGRDNDCAKCDAIYAQSRQTNSITTQTTPSTTLPSTTTTTTTTNSITHSRNACKKLKCPQCNWRYKYHETLEQHLREKHSDSVSTSECMYCLQNTPHPRLGRGEQYKCGYKPYKCAICDYSTTTKGNLHIHEQSDKHLSNEKALKNLKTTELNTNTVVNSLNAGDVSLSSTSDDLLPTSSQSNDNKNELNEFDMITNLKKHTNKDQINTKQQPQQIKSTTTTTTTTTSTMYTNSPRSSSSTLNDKSSNNIIKSSTENIDNNNNKQQQLSSTSSSQQQQQSLQTINNNNSTKSPKLQQIIKYICPLCQIECDNQDQLQKHLKDSHDVKNEKALKSLISTASTTTTTIINNNDYEKANKDNEIMHLRKSSISQHQKQDITNNNNNDDDDTIYSDDEQNQNNSTHANNTHYKYSCLSCNLNTTNIDTYIEHMKSNQLISNNTCLLCFKDHRSKNELERHVNLKHLSIKHNQNQINSVHQQFLNAMFLNAAAAAATTGTSPPPPPPLVSSSAVAAVGPTYQQSSNTLNDNTQLAQKNKNKQLQQQQQQQQSSSDKENTSTPTNNDNLGKIYRKLLYEFGSQVVKNYNHKTQQQQQDQDQNEQIESKSTNDNNNNDSINVDTSTQSDSDYEEQHQHHQKDQQIDQNRLLISNNNNNNNNENESNKHKCIYCDKIFDDIFIYKTHLEEDHNIIIESENINNFVEKMASKLSGASSQTQTTHLLPPSSSSTPSTLTPSTNLPASSNSSLKTFSTAALLSNNTNKKQHEINSSSTLPIDSLLAGSTNFNNILNNLTASYSTLTSGAATTDTAAMIAAMANIFKTNNFDASLFNTTSFFNNPLLNPYLFGAGVPSPVVGASSNVVTTPVATTPTFTSVANSVTPSTVPTISNTQNLLVTPTTSGSIVSTTGALSPSSYGQDATRRRRTRITEEQLKVLRDHFDINKSPSEEQIMEIARKTGLTPKVIKHWFRNTLFKERQKDKDSPYNFNNPPVTHLNLEEYEKTCKIDSTKDQQQQQQQQQKSNENELSQNNNFSNKRKLSNDDDNNNNNNKNNDDDEEEKLDNEEKKIKSEDENENFNNNKQIKNEYCYYYDNNNNQDNNNIIEDNNITINKQLNSLNDDNNNNNNNNNSNTSTNNNCNNIANNNNNNKKFEEQISTINELLLNNNNENKQEQKQFDNNNAVTSDDNDDENEKYSNTYDYDENNSNLNETKINSNINNNNYNNMSSSLNDMYNSNSTLASSTHHHHHHHHHSSSSKRPNRTKFTDMQIERLTQAFMQQRYPKDDDVAKLSKELRLNQRVITVWFQNARQKARKCGENFNINILKGKVTGGNCSNNTGNTSNEQDDDTSSYVQNDEDYDDMDNENENGEEFDDSNTNDSIENERNDQNSNQTKQLDHHPSLTTSTSGMNPLLNESIMQLYNTLYNNLKSTMDPNNNSVLATPTGSNRERSRSIDDTRGGMTSATKSDNNSVNGSVMSDSRRSSPTGFMNDDAPTTPLTSADSKRLRTTILPEQQDVLMQRYQEDQNPSRKKLDDIAREVSLKKRVVQVWFQNTRARERKGMIKVNQQVISKKCPFCGMVFRIRSAMESHLLMKHSECVSKDSLNVDSFPDADSSEPSAITTSQQSSSKQAYVSTSHASSSSSSSSSSSPDNLRKSSSGSNVNQQSKSTSKSTGLSSSSNNTNTFSTTAAASAATTAALQDNFANLYNPLAAAASQFPFASNFGAALNPFYNTILQANLAQLMQQMKQQQQQMLNNNSANTSTSSNESGESPLDLSGSGAGKRIDSTSTTDHVSRSSQFQRTHSLSDRSRTPTPNLHRSSSQVLTNSQTKNNNKTLEQLTAQNLNNQRRVRTQMSQFQINIMKCLFVEYKTPTMMECEQLGKEIGLKKRVVQVWFQNARAKEKKNPKCLKLTDMTGNYEASTDRCVLCNYTYTNSSQQRDHLFTKAHMNKLASYVRANSNNTSNSLQQMNKQMSNSSPESIGDDADESSYYNDDDDDTTGNNDDEYDDESTNDQSNQQISEENKPNMNQNNINNNNNNNLFSMFQGIEPSSVQNIYNLIKMLNPQQQQLMASSTNSAAMPNLFQFPFMSQFLNASQAQEQGQMPLDSLIVSKQALEKIERKLKDNPKSIQYTIDGSTIADLRKNNYDVIEQSTNNKHYLCKQCRCVWTNKEQIKSHPCNNNSKSNENQIVKLEQIEFKCVPCDKTYSRMQEFYEHTTKNTHIDNCNKKRKQIDRNEYTDKQQQLGFKKLKP